MEQLIEFAGNHPLLSGGFVFAILALLWGEISRFTRGYKELGPAEVVPLINKGKATVVDITPPAEFSKGHIVGAKNMPASRFDKIDPEIGKMISGPVVVVCKRGQSAHPVAAAMVKLGAKDVTVLKGGITQWLADNYPVTRD